MTVKEIKNKLTELDIGIDCEDPAYTCKWTGDRIPARIDLVAPKGHHFDVIGVHCDCGHQGENMRACWDSIEREIKSGGMKTVECTKETPCDDWDDKDDCCPVGGEE